MATGARDWRTWLGATGLLCVSLAYFVPAAVANSDLTDGGYCLFMDEEITFGGVRKILHAPDRKTFRKMVIDGDDHRYGRIVWYSAALVSWVPERVYGEPGQIVATRMLYATALWAAYLILVLTFIPGWLFRNVALAALIFLPSTPYYASMPKPEPLQLLFLALFLRSGAAVRFCFGWHWLFLGLAFGAKISTAPLVVPFVLVGCVAEVLADRPGSAAGVARLAGRRVWDGLALAAVAFVIGWVVAVPALFDGSCGVRTWMNAIISNLGHGHDDASVTAGSWVDLIYNRWTVMPVWLLMALTALTAALAGVLSVRLARRRQFGPEYLGLVALLVGLALLVPIVLKVKRLWPIYLHPAAVLFCVSAFAMSDGCIRVYLRGGSRRVARALVIVLALVVTYYQSAQIAGEYRTLVTRTQQPYHQARMREYRALGAMFDDLSDKLGRRVIVAYDPVFYLHDQSPKLFHARYYGSFLDWHLSFDVVIVDKNSAYWIPDPRVPEPGSAATENKVKGLEGYLKHVRGGGSAGSAEPTYVPVEFPCENVLVLMRADLAARTGARVQP